MSAPIGLLHPGEMGAAIGAQLHQSGHRVLWASADRSAATRARAEAAGLVDVGTADAMAAECDVILSICPPAGAAETARSVPSFWGTYVDANAIAPATTRSIGAEVTATGARYVDASIIGLPADPRLHLSGPDAARIAALLTGPTVLVVSAEIGAASALKVAYAAWTKGSQALLIAAREFAIAADVEPALLAEWRTSLPQLEDRYRSATLSADRKGWRWEREMLEIAEAFEAVGLPGGFHQAAAAVFGARPRPAA